MGIRQFQKILSKWIVQEYESYQDTLLSDEFILGAQQALHNLMVKIRTLTGD